MTGSKPTPPPAIQGTNRTAWVLRRYIWRRCNVRNEHFMGAVVGREGSGKSHTALKIAELVDPSFTADRVLFDPESFVDRFRSDDLGQGDVIVLDEAGVGLGNRTWYEKEQVLANQVLQTVRDENMAAIFTLPALEELDTQTENRLIAYLELNEKDEEEGYVRGRFKRIQIDRGPQRRGTYEKYPRRQKGGRKMKIKTIAFTPPSPSLVEAYEERKAAFKEELYAEYLDETEEEGDDGPDLRDLAAQLVNDGIQPYLGRHAQNGTPYINADLIAVDHEVSKSDAKTIKSLIEREIDVEQVAAGIETQEATAD